MLLADAYGGTWHMMCQQQNASALEGNTLIGSCNRKQLVGRIGIYCIVEIEETLKLYLAYPCLTLTFKRLGVRRMLWETCKDD